MSCEARVSAAPVGRKQLVDEFLRCTMPRELAAKFGVDENWVYDELLDEFRQRERELELEQQVAVQQYFSLLRRIETAAWQAWDRSWQPRQKRVVKEVRDAKGERTETTTTTEQPAGDPRYLAIAQRCLERRVAWQKLLPPKSRIDNEFHKNPQAALKKAIAEARARQEAVEARRREAAEIERTIARK